MPVLTKYIVERDGIEKMTFVSKAEAEAYDKLLATAEKLSKLLDQSNLLDNPDQRENLALFLAENKTELQEALSPRRKKTHKPSVTETDINDDPQLDLTDAAPRKPLADLVIEPDDAMLYEEEEEKVVDFNLLQ